MNSSLFLVLFTFAASWTTEALGVHALFGFMAGLVASKNERLISDLVERIESLGMTLLLPFFFALTGLPTRLEVLAGGAALVYTLAIFALAVAGKLAGTAVAARIIGVNSKDAIARGVLMNSRGLVELVILNAALDLGVTSSNLFTMMVVMALVTTCMTTPMVSAMKLGRQMVT